MPATPPRDEPALPKLRRFRFDTADPTVAREVDDADGRTGPPPQRPGEPARTIEAAEAPAAPVARAAGTPAADLRESDRLLAALDNPGSSAGDGARTAASTDSKSGPRTGPTTPTETDPRTGPTALGPHPDPSTLTETGPRTGPTSVAETGPRTGRSDLPAGRAGSAQTRRRRSPWALAALGVVAALLIGLVAWFVLAPEDEPAGSAGSAGPEPDVSVGEWAAEVCGELTEFQTAALPIRAEAAKASASDSAGAVSDDLRRQSAKLLGTLADDLQAVGLPSQSEAAATGHTTIISAVNAAATSAEAAGGSTAGSQQDATAAVLSALDRPVTIFRTTVAALPAGDRDAVTAEAGCVPLL